MKMKNELPSFWNRGPGELRNGLLPHVRFSKIVLDWIPGRGFRILCHWNCDSGFLCLAGFRIPWPELPILKLRILNFISKKFQYYIGIRNSLHEENDTTILSKPQLLLQLVCMSLPFLPEWLDEVGILWCWLFPKLEVVKLQIALTNSVEELGLKMWILDS